MIKDMEKNEGLHTLSQTERDILYAATDVAGEDGEFVAHDLARHTLARDISHAKVSSCIQIAFGKRVYETRSRFQNKKLCFAGSASTRLMAWALPMSCKKALTAGDQE